MHKEAPTRSTGSRTGSIGTALVFAAGVLAVQTLPSLPPCWLDIALAGVAIVVYWRFPRLRLPALLALAFAWTAWRAALALDARLPRDMEGRDFDIVGTIGSLPEVRTGATLFDFDVESAALDDAHVPLHGQLRLAWYGAPPDTPAACSRWKLHVRLKRPRALLDPGAFDSERQALERRRIAVGYVRDEVAPQHLGERRWCIDRLRAGISTAIAAHVADSHDARLLQALAVGDTRGLDDGDWEIARVNGVSHLLAISGFHVGVAAFAGVLAVRVLWWLLPWLALRVPRQPVQALAAVVVGTAYGALAGFGLPTDRTLLMIAVVALANCSRRATGGAQALALALLAILVADPLSVLSAGFWLSFAGVAFLMLGFARPRNMVGHLRALGGAQWAMSVALLPLSVWFFGQASLLGALSNLVAVPVVSLLAVPATLLGIALLPLSTAAAAVCWRLAAAVMHVLWHFLAWLSALPIAQWYLPLASWWSVALALVGALWLLLPRGVPARWLGVVLFLPLLLPRTDAPESGGFRLDVLDVGQGLSVLVRTRDHALLYDAGAKYPSGFDLGEAAVLPSLHAFGVRRLDELMISHGDNDHAGGGPAVARAYPMAALSGSEPERSRLPLVLCRAGQHWRWDDVDFRVLHPTAEWADSDNDGSCVLLVTGRGGRALLTGDISTRVEGAVADAAGVDDMPLVLVVPHHGSKTSSGEAFLRTLRPRLALVSAGWRNRFGHPAPVVVARYRALGIPLLDTSDSGAIEVDFPPDATPFLAWRWRQRQRRYWRE
jgi:competence protein ComEC